MLLKIFIVLVVAMLPVIELRGAIPIAASIGLPVWLALIVAMIGNVIPMPFIFRFGREVLEKGAKSERKRIRKICKWCIKKGNKGSEKLEAKTKNSIYIALLLFVGIPLPGTGAWTGTLAATFLNLDYKKSMIAVGCGTLLAGLIMLAISFGLFDLIF
ncbi:small multi-drug export protein [Candidatus Saccharibacteria bacterium]|nr:small multi-drug export protein [Candidatus Saccharibacteria bacterium]